MKVHQRIPVDLQHVTDGAKIIPRKEKDPNHDRGNDEDIKKKSQVVKKDIDQKAEVANLVNINNIHSDNKIHFRLDILFFYLLF